MSENGIQSAKIKIGLSLVWFIFTFSLVFWWWVFSLHQLDLLSEVIEAQKYSSVRRMLLWEGAVLVVAVFIGGLVLIILTNREKKRNEQLRNFFSNYSHDLKTSLTRLRLRTEILAEKNNSPDIQKLLVEANRLDLQLENSLWLSRTDSQKLYLNKIKLSTIIGYLRSEWPELEIKLNQDAMLLADDLALKSVFRNIFQNAWLHGGAHTVEINPVIKNNIWHIDIQDDGAGFNGEYTSLGQNLMKSQHSKGNGLGLYLTRDLILRMQGKIFFIKTGQGFNLSLHIKSAGV